MALRSLHSLLGRFAGITPPHESVKTTVVAVIKQELGISIDPSRVSVKNKTVFVDVPPTTRSEVALHKAAILRAVSEVLGPRVIRDIC